MMAVRSNGELCSSSFICCRLMTYEPESVEPSSASIRDSPTAVEHSLIVDEEGVAWGEADVNGLFSRCRRQDTTKLIQCGLVFGGLLCGLEPGRAEDEFPVSSRTQHREPKPWRAPGNRRAEKLYAAEKREAVRGESRDRGTGVEQQRGAISLVLLCAEPARNFNLGLVRVQRNRAGFGDVGVRAGPQGNDLLSHDNAERFRGTSICRNVEAASHVSEAMLPNGCINCPDVRDAHSTFEQACQQRLWQSCQQFVRTASRTHTPSSPYGSP